MPIIEFDGQEITVKPSANLRKSLLKAKTTPHGKGARLFNCQGMGTCGTCAVEIEGEVSEKTAVERWRLGFPPHQPQSGLRLACQVKVLGNLHIKKHDGFWGQQIMADRQAEE